MLFQYADHQDAQPLTCSMVTTDNKTFGIHRAADFQLRRAGNQIQLSWSADHTGWRLEAQTNSLTTGLGTN